MLLRRLLARKEMRKQVRVKEIYTIYSIYNIFGQPASAPLFKVEK